MDEVKNATTDSEEEEEISDSANISNTPLDLESTTTTTPNIDDLKQLEKDKKSIYSHPLFPLLGIATTTISTIDFKLAFFPLSALLFEKCEIATRSINSFDNDSSLTSFGNEIEEFLLHQQSAGKSLFTNNPEVDSLVGNGQILQFN